MATITTRAGKGSPLTNNEVDANFTNLNSDKQEVLTEGAFADGDKTKLDGIEAGADVTDTANVTAAGALMDSEVTNLAQVKAFDSSDYATAAQGALADSALQSIPDNYILNTGDSITGDLSFGDGDKAIFGADSDLQIYSNGSTSYISESGSGNLRINGADVQITDTSFNKYFLGSGDVARLYHADAQKLATTSTGIDVTGVITTDGMTTSGNVDFGDSDIARFGAGNDLQIYHDGANSYIEDAGTGSLFIRGTSLILEDAGGNDYIAMTDTGAGGTVEIKHNAATKLSTTSTGIDVTGTVTADGLTVDKEGSDHIVLTDTSSSNALNIGVGNTVCDISVDPTDSIGSSDLRFSVDGNYALNIAEGGDISFYEDTGTTPKFFWDASAESLGIGTSSPARTVHISSATPILRLQDSNSTGSGIVSFVEFSDSANAQAGYVGYGGSSNSDLSIRNNLSGGDIAFVADYTEAMRIDSNGNVGIGTSSPDFALDVLSGTASSAVAQFTGTNPNRGLKISTSLENSVNDAGVILDAQQASGELMLATGGSERMRIDSSGNLLVGKTSQTPTTVGCELIPSGLVNATRETNPPLQLTRLSNTGDIALFKKDTTIVGTIGAASDNSFIIEGPSSGFAFGTSNIIPSNGSNAFVDNQKSLGASSYRWKNLYLSGGVYLGGTGSANHLDDYETGTWSPEYLAQTGTLSATYASQTGAVYTKIGNAVHVSGCLRTNTLSLGTASGDLFIGNLPFTSLNDDSVRAVVSITAANSFGGDYPLSGYVEENATRIRLWYRSSVNGADLKSNVSDLDTTTSYKNFLFFSATYTV
jgi:hypothetical protein